MSVIAILRMRRVALRLCGGLCLFVLVGLLAACGGGQKSDSTALAIGNVAVDSYEHQGGGVSNAQYYADEIVNTAKLSTSDKKKLLGKMLDWADANAPADASSIQRRLDSLG